MVKNANFHLFFVGALLTKLRMAHLNDKVSISLVRELVLSSDPTNTNSKSILNSWYHFTPTKAYIYQLTFTSIPGTKSGWQILGY